MNAVRNPRVLAAAVAVGVAAVLSVAGPAHAAPAGKGPSPSKCRVADLNTGASFTDIAVAIAAAGAGDTLQIKGTCVGHDLVIDKELVLNGKPANAGATTPTIDAAQLGGVLQVAVGASLTLTGDLVITGGRAQLGGGISNRGLLLLADSVSVTGNTAVGRDNAGGGIWNGQDGSLALEGNASVTGNTSRMGAGIANVGRVGLYDSSSVSNNVGSTTQSMGGGIFGGRIVLSDSARVSGNSAQTGAGVYTDERVTIEGSATIAGNIAVGRGGGVFLDSRGELKLADSASIEDNHAGSGAGIFLNSITYEQQTVASLAVIGGSARVAGNVAVERGGGVFVESASVLTLEENAMVTGNSANRGGGVYSKGEVSGASLVSDNTAAAEADADVVNDGGTVTP